MKTPSIEMLGRRLVHDSAMMLATTLQFAVEGHNAWMALHPDEPAWDLEPLRLARIRCLDLAKRMRRRGANVVELAPEFEAVANEARPEIERLAKFHAERATDENTRQAE